MSLLLRRGLVEKLKQMGLGKGRNLVKHQLSEERYTAAVARDDKDVKETQNPFEIIHRTHWALK